MDMKLNQLRYLVTIAEQGSIAKASRALFISQPSVSQAVKELEEELGFDILVRTRQGVTFSPKGTQVLEIARRIVRELGKLEHLKVEEREALWGRLAVGGTSYFSDLLLLRTIVDMHEEYPYLSIRLVENDSQSILSLLRDGTLNLGVILYCNIDEVFFRGKMEEYDLHATPLLEDEMIFVVGEHHPLAGREKAGMAEILGYPVIQYKAAINEQTHRLFLQYRTDLDILYIDDFSSLWRLPQIGNYAFLSPSLALKHRNVPGLKPVRIADLDYHCTICYVHNDTPMTLAEQEVVAHLTQVGRTL